jgi:hypothetical protein
MMEGTSIVTPEMPLIPERLSVMPDDAKTTLKVYPIPATNKLFISSADITADYKVISLHGSVLLEGKLTGQQIDVHQLQAGIYLLKVDEKVVSFVKE